MVIFAHAPELLDGNKSREPVTALFHTSLTAGTVAVDGFFLISGYLIAASFMSDPRSYFLKRILRIYPAFLACSVLSLLVIGPLLGGELPRGIEWLRALYRMAILATPLSDNAMSGMHIETLNASMWTIAYEFRCYVLAAVFGWLGLYKHRRLFLVLSLAVLGATLLPLPHAESDRLAALVGRPDEDVRLCGVFMIGTCFRLYRPVMKRWVAGLCVLALLPLLFLEHSAEIALVLLGGYFLFWVSFHTAWRPMLTINAKNDISYGIYLYSWPMSALLIWFWNDIPLWMLDVGTLIAAAACGALSWFVIEKPAMALRTLKLSKPRQIRAAALNNQD